MNLEIGSHEAKTRLPELLRGIQAGNRYTITLRGEPVADLVPAKPQRRRCRSRGGTNAPADAECDADQGHRRQNVDQRRPRMSYVLDNSAAMYCLLNHGQPADVTYALNLQKAFGPQISPIYADGSEACLTTLDHLPGQP